MLMRKCVAASASSGFPELPVEAPGPAASNREIQEHKAVKHGELTLVEYGEETSRRMRHEIGDCHFARHDECGRAGEQSDQQQKAADDLDRTREADQRERLQVVKACHMRKSEMLGEPVLKKKERRDDPQDAERTVGPD